MQGTRGVWDAAHLSSSYAVRERQHVAKDLAASLGEANETRRARHGEATPDQSHGARDRMVRIASNHRSSCPPSLPWNTRPARGSITCTYVPRGCVSLQTDTEPRRQAPDRLTDGDVPRSCGAAELRGAAEKSKGQDCANQYRAAAGRAGGTAPASLPGESRPDNRSS